jgi:hypothetical protein
LKAENSEISAWIREFFSMESFSGMCLHVYFSEDIADSDYILVNIGLMYMFQDRQQRVTDKKEHEENEEYTKALRQNAETALANLPFHLPATSNMISALLLGVCYILTYFVIYSADSALRLSMPLKYQSHHCRGLCHAKHQSYAKLWDTIVYQL